MRPRLLNRGLLPWLVCAVLLSIVPGQKASLPAQAKEPPADGKLDFARDIQPLFAAHCHRCYGSERQEAGYRLDQREPAFRGGESGERAIVAGNADESPLVQYIRGDDPDFVMPPEGERLSEAQVKRIAAWVRQGARWSE